eukprot:GILJ01006967.1.p1 GENE.GILJ01006967.1~~GILJ01006967.1.p1  ORF type:complete len:206 (-),score=50.62 GILJ01006967.1:240-830(-)
MPFLRGQPKGMSDSRGFKFDEVQEAMNSSPAAFLQKGEWMSEDLMQRFAANPKLLQTMANPRFNQALAELQRDPKAALVKYANDQEMREFLMEFSQIMGDHFTKLGAAQEQKQQTQQAVIETLQPVQPKDELQMAADRALADPEIRALLQDPTVQKLLNDLRSSQQVDIRRVMMDPVMAPKVRKLMASGLLGTASG